MPQPADLQGGVELVRRGEHVLGPDGRAERADHLGARARQGRPVRQVAGGRAGLVDQPEPVLGLAHPGLAERQPRLPAHRRVRLAGRARARLRRAPGRPAPPGDRRPGPAEPGRPDRPVHDAPGARGARLLVRVGVDAVRPGALPVREPRVVRQPLPGRLHRRVHRPDPRLVLHPARARHRAVRPAGLPLLRQPRHRARQRRPEDVQEPAQLPGRERGVRHLRLGRHALVPDGQPGAARREPDRHRAGHQGRRPAGDPAAVELLLLLRAVRQRRVLRGTSFGSQRARARPLHPGQDPGGGDRDRASCSTSTTSAAPARRCATTWRC